MATNVIRRNERVIFADMLSSPPPPRISTGYGRGSGCLFQAYPLPMRNILVPQTGHVPWVAGLPFFRVTSVGLLISLFVRHLRQ